MITVLVSSKLTVFVWRFRKVHSSSANVHGHFSVGSIANNTPRCDDQETIAPFIMCSSLVLPWPIFDHEPCPPRPTSPLQQIISVHPSQQWVTKIRDRLKLEIRTIRERETCSFRKPHILQESEGFVHKENTDGEWSGATNCEHNACKGKPSVAEAFKQKGEQSTWTWRTALSTYLRGD